MRARCEEFCSDIIHDGVVEGKGFAGDYFPVTASSAAADGEYEGLKDSSEVHSGSQRTTQCWSRQFVECVYVVAVAMAEK